MELDSTDLLDIVMELRKMYRIQIPEADYPQLGSMDSTVTYLTPLLKDAHATRRRRAHGVRVPHDASRSSPERSSVRKSVERHRRPSADFARGLFLFPASCPRTQGLLPMVSIRPVTRALVPVSSDAAQRGFPGSRTTTSFNRTRRSGTCSRSGPENVLRVKMPHCHVE